MDCKTVQRSALCRSRREHSNAYLLAKFGFDTAENEPCKVCPLSAYRSPRSLQFYQSLSLSLKFKGPMAVCEITDSHQTNFERLILTTSEVDSMLVASGLRRRMNNELNFPPNFERLVLGCITADFCE